MSSLMGKRGVSTDKVSASTFTLAGKTVNELATAAGYANRDTSRVLATVEYVGSAMDEMASRDTVFGQNYVDPYFDGSTISTLRWIISNMTLVDGTTLVGRSSAHECSLKVPAGRLPSSGDYILGLSGSIPAGATLTISYGDDLLASFTGPETDFSIAFSTSTATQQLSIRITADATARLSTCLLIAPVFLCTVSALMSYYMDAKLRNLFAAGDAVAMTTLIQYVAQNAIPLTDERRLVRGNTVVPNGYAGADDRRVARIFESPLVSDTHGPRAAVGQMGTLHPADQAAVLGAGWTISDTALADGFVYVFHAITHVTSILLTTDPHMRYTISVIKADDPSAPVVTVVHGTGTMLTISVNHAAMAVYLRGERVEGTDTQTVVGFDIQTAVSDLTVQPNVIAQAVDQQSLSGTTVANLDRIRVPDTWYPITAIGSAVSVEPAVFASSTVVKDRRMPLIERLGATYVSACAQVDYNQAQGRLVITPMAVVDVTGIEIAPSRAGQYTVTLSGYDTDGVMVVTDVVGYHCIDATDIVISRALTMHNLTGITVTCSNCVLTLLQVAPMWYDPTTNQWSDGVDRVVLGYIRQDAAGHRRMLTRGTTLANGGMVFGPLESALSIDPETGLMVMTHNTSMDATTL